MSFDVKVFTELEYEHWNSRAGAFEANVSRLTDGSIEALLRGARVGPDKRVLDVGCGPGHMSGRAAALGARVIGSDFAPAFLDLARRTRPDVEFVEADAQALPFADAAFDAVVANFVVLHLAQPELGMREFHRVLAPRGRVAVSTWQDPSKARAFGAFLDAAVAIGYQPPARPTGPNAWRFADRAVFEALLCTAGFGDVAVEPVVWEFVHPDAAAFWDAMMSVSISIRTLYESLSADQQTAMRGAFEEVTKPYQRDGRLFVPAAAWVASGAKA